MNALLEILHQRIAEDGPLPLAEYMALALGHPEHGYYTARDPLGVNGDFTTAPEISQMFGEVLGLWCAVVWDQMACPQTLHLVELGPGRGTLMADMLRAAAVVPPFVAALDVHLVEFSPILRQRQQAALASSSVPVAWHLSPDTLPDGPCLIIANEFFDALPVHQLIKRGEDWRQRAVTWQEAEQTLALIETADDGGLAARLGPAIQQAPEGSIAELCPQAEALMATLATRLVRFGGAALIIDYGHATGAVGDTVQAVKDHVYHPILVDPGRADLTAHVDFAALAQAARRVGARVEGPQTQGQLLRALGIVERAQALGHTARARGDQDTASAIDAALTRLIDDAEMGTLFKAMAVVHPHQPLTPGFLAPGFDEVTP